LVVDHVTSPTGLVFPLREIVREAHARGVRVLVDGAHAPGMLDLALSELGADYYTGNLHKWCCAPKSAAFLHVQRQWQAEVRPLVISHGATSERTDRSRFLLEFDWVGTVDPTALLCVPKVLSAIADWLPGGWAEAREKNRALALAARRVLGQALEVALPCPDDMIGSLAAFALPRMVDLAPAKANWDPLHLALFEQHRIEVPVYHWAGKRLLRVSAALYNELSEYERLGDVLRKYRRA
jgi:isopenicillin-N epimerase